MDAPAGNGTELKAIIEASEKAASLTHQLLAYAGKGQFKITEFDVSRLVRSSADLLRVSIPKSVEVQMDVPRTLPAVRGDSSQIQQVVMNLVINAAEAIEDHKCGSVKIAASVRDLDAAFRAPHWRQHHSRPLHRDCSPGQWMRHGRGDEGKDLRPVFHNEVYGTRTRSGGGPRHSEVSRRDDYSRKQALPREHLYCLPPLQQTSSCGIGLQGCHSCRGASRYCARRGRRRTCARFH